MDYNYALKSILLAQEVLYTMGDKLSVLWMPSIYVFSIAFSPNCKGTQAGNCTENYIHTSLPSIQHLQS